MVDKESSSDTSGSDSESYESSSSEEVVLKPIFVSKKQRKSHEKPNEKSNARTNRSSPTEVAGNADREDVNRKKEIALKKASREVRIEEADGVEFDGIDDTDDIYPEKEYEEWRRREKDRYRRDRELMMQEEEMKDEIVRRGNLSEQELMEDFKKRQQKKDLLASERPKNYYRGAFFTDNEDINRLLKRTYEHIGDNDDDDDNARDHSRPTKLKFN